MSHAHEDLAQRMTQRLQEQLQVTWLEVIDESAAHAGHAGTGGRTSGSHFRVRIASPLFTQLSRVERHRLVYDALRDFIAQGVHALVIETL